MTILSKRAMDRLRAAYYSEYRLRPRCLDLAGTVTEPDEPALKSARVRQARAYALQESIHWGEPQVFFLAPGVASWVAAAVEGYAVRGGVLGGEILVETARPELAESAGHLAAFGITRQAAHAYLARLPVWPEFRVREAALSLQSLFYVISGWKPLLLERNRARAYQQKQIAEAIRQRKESGQAESYPLEQERILLSLIKAGDRNAARRVLNDMLGAMFLHAPKLVVLRARVIELMGYLTRAAIEDSPVLESFLERSHRWVEHLIEAPDFESLCEGLTRALDEFMEGIYLHGYNLSNSKVAAVLDVISRQYAGRITLRTLARQVGLSPCRVAHLVKESTGKSVLQIAQQVRIQNAKHLLDRTSKSCTEIAYAVGYNDQSYFIKHFKRLVGVTPTRYRRRYVFGRDAGPAA
ncbi:MAG: helix-turn-helix transcriptional regulator [Kiritimatiellae bacterium]|nr:helix-turn-helix transcriptional regulator [Kiritimatiellia bacterium]